MPWTSTDASAKTRAADDPAKQQAWAATANAVLKKTGNEQSAIKIANAQVNRMGGRYRPPQTQA